MNTVPNERVLASAGSGKTYRLTNRIIELLAKGATPQSIIALTFTRKAAGEFFQATITKLADAASDTKQASALAENINKPEMGCGEFAALLRQLVSQLDRLNFGTLDSFYSTVVRSFPFELGLNGNFDILDENQQQIERDRLLLQAFSRAPGKQRDALIQAFKNATWGTEERSMHSKLNRYIQENHSLYWEIPQIYDWGNTTHIWPNDCPWYTPVEDWNEQLRQLRAHIMAHDPTSKQIDAIDTFLDSVSGWQPGLPIPKTRFLTNCLEAWSDISKGSARINIGGKKFECSPVFCECIQNCITPLLGSEVKRRVMQTKGLYQLLDDYEALYSEQLRQAGKLTFNDILLLLEQSEVSQNIQFRLDTRYDHWLLDEFQDTNRRQWSILQNLIDEVVQEPERSFFYVGDTKQSIYGWRGGDYRLFDDVFRRYHYALNTEQLPSSWRSSPAIIDCVNALFGDAAAIETWLGKEGQDAARQWSENWTPHASEHKNRAGYTGAYRVDTQDDAYQLTGHIIQEINPLERGLSCAVLVRTNGHAQEQALALQQMGLHAVAVTDKKITPENVYAVLIHAIAKLAAYPADAFAWQTLQMSPVGEIVRANNFSASDVSEISLQKITYGGFTELFTFWTEQIGKSDSAEEQVRELCEHFDRNYRRNTVDFLRYVEDSKQPEYDADDIIRVMTVHKSKGLGFDVVILPDISDKSITHKRDGLTLHRNAHGEPEWVFDMPIKEACEADEELQSIYQASQSESAYEGLCTYYVALTRAKYGLYLINSATARTASRNLSRLIYDLYGSDGEEHVIGNSKPCRLLTDWGDRSWHEQIETKISNTEQAAKHSLPELVKRPMRTEYAQASKQHSRSDPFRFEGIDSRKHGIAVHGLFSKIIDARELPTLPDTPAANEVSACIECTAIYNLLCPPDGTDIWIERSFDYIEDGIWHTGVFDRVHIYKDDFRSFKATIIDYKTDRIASEEKRENSIERHTAQMQDYQAALAKLIGCQPEQVELCIFFTDTREVITL